jgi:hypothetical protein
VALDPLQRLPHRQNTLRPRFISSTDISAAIDAAALLHHFDLAPSSMKNFEKRRKSHLDNPDPSR